MKRLDGVSIKTESNNGRPVVVLTKRNVRWKAFEQNCTEPCMLDIATISKKQALALGTMLIQAAR